MNPKKNEAAPKPLPQLSLRVDEQKSSKLPALPKSEPQSIVMQIPYSDNDGKEENSESEETQKQDTMRDQRYVQIFNIL